MDRFGIPAHMLPPGLDALVKKCATLYPEQNNPLQVNSRIKYWLGGPDPLDYVSMYCNPGDSSLRVPQHWHYISFGLSDLHGDGRVHEVLPADQCDKPSGFGFELTFRLKKEPTEEFPPFWPAELMQALAKYIFSSGSVFFPGDHVSWQHSLDYSESRIHHMLISTDPQMDKVETPFGQVEFYQIVGITKEELDAVQHWSGLGVLDILKTLPIAGGEWWVTDMRRGESMQEIDPGCIDIINEGIEKDGSNLSGVTARCSWVEIEPDEDFSECGIGGGKLREGPCLQESEGPRISQQDSQKIKNELTKGLLNALPCKQEEPDISEQDEHDAEAHAPEPSELCVTRYFDGLHLTFNCEAGNVLPLTIRGRVKHGRHFTIKSELGDTAITFVASSVTGTFVTPATPYAARGNWLQVLISDSLALEMSKDFNILSGKSRNISYPMTFSWEAEKLKITVVAD